MQKKKNSVMIVSLMVVVGLGLVIANSTDIQKNLTDILSHKNEPPVPTGPGAKASDAEKDAIKASLVASAATRKGGPIKTSEDGEPQMPTTIPDKPTILIEAPTKYKPTENDNTVTSGWYNQNSDVRNKEAQADQKAAATGGGN